MERSGRWAGPERGYRRWRKGLRVVGDPGDVFEAEAAARGGAVFTAADFANEVSGEAGGADVLVVARKQNGVQDVCGHRAGAGHALFRYWLGAAGGGTRGLRYSDHNGHGGMSLLGDDGDGCVVSGVVVVRQGQAGTKIGGGGGVADGGDSKRDRWFIVELGNSSSNRGVVVVLVDGVFLHLLRDIHRAVARHLLSADKDRAGGGGIGEVFDKAGRAVFAAVIAAVEFSVVGRSFVADHAHVFVFVRVGIIVVGLDRGCVGELLGVFLLTAVDFILLFVAVRVHLLRGLRGRGCWR